MKSLPARLPDAAARSMIGENRVRAWLRDVKPPPEERRRRWKEAEEEAAAAAAARLNFQENSQTFARGIAFDRLEKIGKIDFSRAKSSEAKGKSVAAAWQDNPPMLRTFQNIAQSEILGEDDR